VTVHEALAEGRLAEAVAMQETAVAADLANPRARRLLVDLLAFAGRIDDALEHLGSIRSEEPEWHEAERNLRDLFEAERMRRTGEPRIYPEPPPRHAALRLRAIRHLCESQSEEAVHCIDDADAVTPHLRGFLDGREFEGLHDADDRFASVLEAFCAGEYLWFAWEAIRKVALEPAGVLLDQLYRPATVTLRDGSVFAVTVPLVYPASHVSEGEFALGTETDLICPDNGPTRCIGGKLLLVGDEEVRLAERRMIEVR
jgi:type VI secretion system protein ImpE